MPRSDSAPVAAPGSHGHTEYRHPAFATISASRVNGQANLFHSNVKHNGFVTISITEAVLYEDGYSSHVHGGAKAVIEVALTEAQWVAFVSRMNMGSGTPCTMQYRQTGPMVMVDGIADPEDTQARFQRQAKEIGNKLDDNMKHRLEQLRELTAGLPKKKLEDFNRNLDALVDNLASNIKFGKEMLTEHAEKVIVDAKVEIDATVQGIVSQLGLKSIRQLTDAAAAVDTPLLGNETKGG